MEDICAVDTEQGLGVESPGSEKGPELSGCLRSLSGLALVKNVSHHGNISQSPLPLPSSSLCSTQLWPWGAEVFAHRANIWYICELRDVKCLSVRNNDVPPRKSHKDMRGGLWGQAAESSCSSAPSGLTVRDGRSTSAQVQLLPGQQAQISQHRNSPELLFLVCCKGEDVTSIIFISSTATWSAFVWPEPMHRITAQPRNFFPVVSPGI